MIDIDDIPDATVIDRAHAALVLVLDAVPAFDDITVHRGEYFKEELLEGGDTKRWLNVLIAPGAPQILAEVLGLGEDDGYEVEFVQVYQIEWLVQRDNDAARDAAFQAGLLAIQAALRADRILGGAARGLTIAPATRENSALPFTAKTLSAVIPVRVQLRGPSPIG